MVRLFAWLLASLFIASSFAPAQDSKTSENPLGPSSPERRARRHTQQYFSVQFPSDWRAMTPDEAIKLRPQLPQDMHYVAPGDQDVFGPVDRWLASGYDGRSLLVRLQAANIAADEGLVALIRKQYEQPISAGARQREVEKSEIIKLGEGQHPAVVCQILTRVSGSGKSYRAQEYYVPTGSKILILSFRSWDNDFGSAYPDFKEIASTLTFPWPAKTPKQLSDMLVTALILGGLLGLIFLALSKTRSQARRV